MGLTAAFTSILAIAWGVFDDYDAGSSKTLTEKETIGNGTGANQANKGYHKLHTLIASANEDVDLTTILGPNGVALGIEQVVILRISTPAANTANIEMKPSAAGGWVGLLKATTDTLLLRPGTTIEVRCLVASAYAITGAAGKLNFP